MEEQEKIYESQIQQHYEQYLIEEEKCRED